jgi:branched-chain amino acid transport system ATP-binding protein
VSATAAQTLASGGDRAGDALLAVRTIEVVYGGSSRVLHGVSLRVGAGQAVALLGTNGAGKTTTIRAISGLLGMHRGRVISGEVDFEGESVLGTAPHDVVKRGLAQVPEGRMVFKSLTVEDNLRIGASTRKAQVVNEGLEQVYELFPRLRERRGQQAGWMSGGEQQMVAIGRALMASPRLLLLDEVSLGLAPLITAEIFQRLAAVRSELGMSVLLVEQNARLALEFAEYAYIMESGRIALEGPTAQLRDDPEVQSTYLGSSTERVSARFGDRSHARPRRRWLA